MIGDKEVWENLSLKTLSDHRLLVTSPADFVNGLLDEAGFTTSELECMKGFVDLLVRVFRGHREAYATGAVRNGRGSDRGGVDTVSEQPFAQR